MYNTLFALASLAAPLWLLLMLAPTWRPVRRFAESAVVPLFLCALYLIGIGAVLVEFGPSILADFGNADGVSRLLAEPAIGLVAWIHILAFDQLVGLYIYRDNMANRYLPLPVQSVLLLLTFMLGPVGFLSYYGLRALRQVQARRTKVEGPRMFEGESAHVLAGVIGLLFTIVCVVALYLKGSPYIGPEGDLNKPIRFNLAVAIFSFTLAAILPLVGFSEAGRRRWRWANVSITLYAYFAETYLTFQGLDPRFSQHIENWTQAILSIGLGVLNGLGYTMLYIILMWQVLRRGSAQRPLMTLALRYGMGAVLLAAAGGIWMVVLRDHLTSGGGDLLLIHALGFHGLQTVPLVAWLLERSALDVAAARRWVHAAGAAWLAGTLFMSAHAALGFPVSAYSPALAAAAVALVAWGFTAVSAVGAPGRQAA